MNGALRRLIEWSEAVWRSLVRGWRWSGRALRAALSLAACAVLWPLLLVATMLLTLALLVVGIAAIVEGWNALLERSQSLLSWLVCLLPSNSKACAEDGQAVLAVLGATWLGALGVTSGIWGLARRHLSKALRTVAGALSRVWKLDWFPRRPMETTVSEVLRLHVLPVLKEMGEINWSWCWLVSGLLLVGAFVALPLFSLSKAGETTATRWNVDIQTSVNQSVSEVVENDVFVHGLAEAVSNSLEARHYVYLFDSAEPRHSFEKGTVFSLVFPPEGDLRSKDGICPSDTAIDWIRDFRAALATCPEAQGGDGKKLELEVKAYSSVAPVRADGSYHRSDALNCEIANQRASAIAHMLVARGEEYLTEDHCKKKLEIAQAKRKPGALCTGTEGMAEVPSGPNFELTHTPWKSYGDMHEARPMDDGTTENRRPKAEIFNRVVQIIFKNDACWRPESHLASRVAKASTTMSGSEDEETKVAYPP